MTVKLLIVDDHTIIREGLTELLNREAGIEVMASVASVSEAMEKIAQSCPDIVLMDIKFPSGSGIDATREIVGANNQVRVIGLSMYQEKHYIQEIFKVGAVGYLSKECDFQEVVDAIKAVADGKTYIARGLQHTAIDDYISQCSKGGAVGTKPELTFREVRVLEYLSDGMSTKEIAHQLNKSTKTIEACRRTIMDKLELYSLAELTKYAIRIGLTAP